MYLAAATLIRRSDWDMYLTALNDVVCERDLFVAVTDLESKGVRTRIVLTSYFVAGPVRHFTIAEFPTIVQC